MKTFFFTTLFLLLFAISSLSPVHSQSLQRALPSYTSIPHYLLHVAYNSTTVLLFGSAVKPIDRGNRDIIVQKQLGAENVLKLKAARKNFPVTNLHVFTADGKIFAFDVIYSDSIASTHNLSALNLLSPDSSQPLVLLSNEMLNTNEMQNYVERIKALPPSHHCPSDSRDKMSIRLDKISMAGPLLFFRFRIANHSNLGYNLDFIRLYIRDKQKAKRISVQEKEILPVFEEPNLPVPGDSAISHILALPAFTLAGGKQFIIEAYEKNGGRSMTLLVSNRTLLKARKL